MGSCLIVQALENEFSSIVHICTTFFLLLCAAEIFYLVTKLPLQITLEDLGHDSDEDGNEEQTDEGIGLDSSGISLPPETDAQNRQETTALRRRERARRRESNRALLHASRSTNSNKKTESDDNEKS